MTYEQIKSKSLNNRPKSYSQIFKDAGLNPTIDEQYIKSFLDDSKFFFNAASADDPNTNWGNSKYVYEKYRTQYEDLTSRARTIDTWLNLYRTEIDKDSYDALKKSISDINTGLNNVNTHFSQKNKFYNQFATQEEFDEWKKVYDYEQYILSTINFEELSNIGANIGHPEDENLWVSSYDPKRDGAVVNKVKWAKRDKEDLTYWAVGATPLLGDDYKKIYAGYAYMTDEEYAIYNYLLGGLDVRAANLYLGMKEKQLSARLAAAISEEYNDTWAEPFLTGFSGFEGAITGLVGGTSALLGGPDIDTTLWGQTSAIMNADNTGAWKVLNDIVGTVSNQLPSAFIGAFTHSPTLGAVSQGVSAGGNAYTQMRKLGYSKDQSKTYGLLVGASEAITQRFLGGISSIGGKYSLSSGVKKLITGIDNGLAKFAMNVTLSAASEGLEESLQTVLDPLFKSWATGEEYEVPEIMDIVYSGLLGAVSAGLIEGTTVGVGTIGANAEAKKVYGNGSGLIQMGLEQGGTAGKLATKYQNSGKSLSGQKLNNLAQAIMNGDKSAIQNAAKTQLAALGENNPDKIAKLIAKKVTGEELTALEERALSKSQNASEILEQLNPDTIVNNQHLESWDDSTDPDALAASMVETEWSENIGTQMIHPEAYSKGTKWRENKNASKKTSTGAQPDDEEKREYSVSADGKTIYDGEDVSIESIASVSGNDIKVKLSNGKVVSASDISFGNEAEATLYRMLARMGVSADSAKEILSTFGTSDSDLAFKYLTNVPLAYKYGTIGYEKGLEGIELSEPLKRVAYNLGRMDAIREGAVGEMKEKSLKKDSKGDIINKTEAENESKDIRVREGGERNGSKDTADKVSRMESRAGQDKGRKENSRSADKEAADLVNAGRKVTAYELGVVGGSKVDTVVTVAKSKETASMKKARAIAEARGLKVTFFVGDNLKIKAKDGSTISARGQILGNSVFIRADHPLYTSEQIMKHEIGHDRIDKKEINLDEVRERLKAKVGANNVKAIADIYEDAYAGSGLTAEEIWEECICDSLGDMNVFSTRKIAEFMDLILPEVKASAESVSKSPTQTRGSPEAKTSRETSNKKPKYISYSKVGQNNVDFINRELRKLYYGIKDGIADGIAIANGDTVFIIDSGKDKGEIDFGVRRMKTIQEAALREEFIRSENDDTISKGYVSNELLEKLEYGRRGDIGRNLRSESGTELQADKGKPQDNQSRISSDNADNRGLNSKLSRELDTEYLSAVENGDMETAQRMVDEAAKKAGYTYKGMHGTDADFNNFDYSYIGDDNKLGLGFYFTNNEKLQFKYDYEKTAYLKINNPIYDNNPVLDDIIQREQELRESGLTQEETLKAIQKEFGYDGIIAEYNRKALVAFNPEQIKSAEPATYDDNGNVIPLSERFNTQEKDIRYSRELYDEDLYTATDDFIRDVLPQDRHAFARSLANKTTGMTKGEIRTIFVSGYVFEADGYMHGEVLGPYDSKTKKMLEAKSNRYDEIDKNRGYASLWSESKVWNAERGDGSDSDLSYRRRSSADDRLFDESSERNASGDNERIRQTVKTEAEIDEIVNKLRQMYDLAPVDNKYSRELSFVDYANEATANEEREQLTNRMLIARTLESTATKEEQPKLKEYKEQMAFYEREELKLSANRAEAQELRFKKGRTPEETQRLKALDFEANEIRNRINIYDKRLLRLESTATLKKVLEREVAKVRKEALEKSKGMLTFYKEGKNKTELRHKIKDFKTRLEGMLNHPTERNYVPGELAKAMIDVCSLIDTDTDLYKNDGSRNMAQVKRNETAEKLQRLNDEYDKLKSSSNYEYASEYEVEISEYIKSLRQEFSGKSLNDMDLVELDTMYQTLRSIEETLRDARKLIGIEEAADIYEVADSIGAEQDKITDKRRKDKPKNETVVNLTLSPVRNVERMSDYNKDSYLVELFHEFEKGERKKNMFVMESYKMFDELTTGKNAKNYEEAMYEPYGETFTDERGRSFRVSKMQMMQAIMSYQREMANGMNHIESDGFSFADLSLLKKGDVKGAVNNSHRIPMGTNMVIGFINDLSTDKWAQDYMAMAHKFFDEKAKNEVNDTYMTLKHRIVAKDVNYIPFEVDKNFIVSEISGEAALQQTINSYGMLKETKDNAGQPLIITGLNNVIQRHIDQVGTVVGLAVPVRNFNKVWNTRTNSKYGSEMIKGIIQRNWGEKGVYSITQTVQDLQGTRRNNLGAGYQKLKSGIITAKFTANPSIVLKQMGSLFTASSELKWRDPIRAVGNLVYTIVNHKKIAAEVDKYTATAWMRRQGLSDAELHTLLSEGQKWKVTKLINKLPAIANPGKWISAMDSAVALSLWNYAKKDVAKSTGLEGEELLKATAELYDSVVENTQSMNDVLHRPEIQRSKDIKSELFGTFKTDLYQTAGQLRLNLGRFMHEKNAENGKALVRTVYGALMSSLWSAGVTFGIGALLGNLDAFEDDDEEVTFESFMQKYGTLVVSDVVGYILPLFGSEAMEIIDKAFNGNTYLNDETFALMPLTTINDLINTIVSVANKGDEATAKMWERVIALSLEILGVPFYNIKKVIKAIFNRYE